uniref:Uncharacterized protein n=1 Tax=Branchiostoma floridae TaxID=7739 RepID=C3Y885_BRAFL|eukprot:XP_002607544.1 hypothetical protein BRAFLDRAFT_106493 [Branchiostoma floridae]
MARKTPKKQVVAHLLDLERFPAAAERTPDTRSRTDTTLCCAGRRPQKDIRGRMVGWHIVSILKNNKCIGKGRVTHLHARKFRKDSSLRETLCKRAPHIPDNEGDIPHISNNEGDTPHISNNEGDTQHISNNEGDTQNISNNEGDTPHISNNEGDTPHISNNEGDTPHISNNEAQLAALSPPSPDNPSAPPSPDNPSAPPSPDNPSAPPSPDNPSVPPSTDNPSAPPSTDNPSAPPSPDNPSVPPSPDNPSAPPSPDNPSVPPSTDNPSAPPSTDNPSAPPSPDNPSAPPSPDNPSAHPSHDNRSAPPSPDNPSVPPSPDNPSAPPSPDNPSAPPSPDNPSAPPSPDNPSAPPSPDNPSAQLVETKTPGTEVRKKGAEGAGPSSLFPIFNKETRRWKTPFKLIDISSWLRMKGMPSLIKPNSQGIMVQCSLGILQGLEKIFFDDNAWFGDQNAQDDMSLWLNEDLYREVLDAYESLTGVNTTDVENPRRFVLYRWKEKYEEEKEQLIADFKPQSKVIVLYLKGWDCEERLSMGAERLAAFRRFRDVVVRHIPHQYSSEMEQPSEQPGKDICDRNIASMKTHIQRYVNEKHDVITAEDMENALETHGGMKGYRIAVAQMVPAKEHHIRNHGPLGRKGAILFAHGTFQKFSDIASAMSLQ